MAPQEWTLPPDLAQRERTPMDTTESSAPAHPCPQRANKDSNISGGYLPIILSLQRPSRSRNNKNQKTEKQDQQREQNGTRAECLVFSKYYASTQSCARTPEERSVVTWRTASSSPERSRHRCTRSSPKFSLRWLAA